MSWKCEEKLDGHVHRSTEAWWQKSKYFDLIWGRFRGTMFIFYLNTNPYIALLDTYWEWFPLIRRADVMSHILFAWDCFQAILGSSYTHWPLKWKRKSWTWYSVMRESNRSQSLISQGSVRCHSWRFLAAQIKSCHSSFPERFQFSLIAIVLARPVVRISASKKCPQLFAVWMLICACPWRYHGHTEMEFLKSFE